MVNLRYDRKTWRRQCKQPIVKARLESAVFMLRQSTSYEQRSWEDDDFQFVWECLRISCENPPEGLWSLHQTIRGHKYTHRNIPSVSYLGAFWVCVKSLQQIAATAEETSVIEARQALRDDNILTWG